MGDEKDDDRPSERSRSGDEGNDRPRKHSPDEEELSRPTKKKRKTKKKRRRQGLLRFLSSVGRHFEPGLLRNIGIGALVLGAIALLIAIFQGWFAIRSSAQPEPIALNALIARGDGGNPNVAVRDFVLCQTFVHWSNVDAPNSWTGVYVPAVPAEEAVFGPQGEVKAPGKIKALFVSRQMRDERDLEAKLNKPIVRALVNQQKGPSPPTLSLLRQSYPDTDFSGCIILDVDDAPWAPGWICLFVGVAIISVFFGVAALAVEFSTGRDEERR